MRWLDTKYIGLVSGRLRNFKRKSDSLWNFSCPFCGDSEKQQKRARGYIYFAKDKLQYTCHNCGITRSVPNLIKHLDLFLYDEYRKELLVERHTYNNPIDSIVFDKPIFYDTGQLKTLKKVSQLEPDHFAKKYVVSRMIPTPYHAKLYHCPSFKKWVNTLIPNKFEHPDMKRVW